MAIGDYLSSLFLGNSGQQEQPEAVKQGTAELWKLYQQAYNVKPIWDGKKWVIPPGALQRFQMLLPMLQAQIQAGRYGQNQQQGNDKGMLGGLIKSTGEGMLGAFGKKVGGFGGAMDKVGGAIKDLFASPETSFQPSGDYSLASGSPADFYQADAQPGADFTTPVMDTGPPVDMSEDWWSNMPVEDIDYSSLFGSGDWAGMY